MTELGLGCVQIGVPYGNATENPLMPETESTAILTRAATAGIRFFDTAAAYGESEFRIGLSGLAKLHPNVEISTKIPAVATEIWQSKNTYWNFLCTTIAESKTKLRIGNFRLLQFHQHDLAFLENQGVQSCMQDLIELGYCKQIGISVYTPEEAIICTQLEHVKALQVPVNLLERRFFAPSLARLYQSEQMLVIGRSIFMQGVLVDDAPLPPVIKSPKLATLRNLLRKSLGEGGLFPSAIAFAKWGLPDLLTIALTGADSVKSLEMNIDAWQISPKQDPNQLAGLDISEAAAYADEHNLLNPLTWNI